MFSFAFDIRIHYEKKIVLLFSVRERVPMKMLSKTTAILLFAYMNNKYTECLQLFKRLGCKEPEQVYSEIQEQYSKYLCGDKKGMQLDILVIKQMQNHTIDNHIIRLRYPIHVQCILTYQCAFNCKYCGVKRLSTLSDEKRVAQVYLERSLDEALRNGVRLFTFHGGDPLFQYGNGIFNLIKKLKDAGSDVFLSSKQFISVETAEKLLQCGIDTIQVSVDTFDEKTEQALYPGLKSFQFITACRSIDNLMASGIRANINVVITKYNYRDIPLLLEKLSCHKNIQYINLSWYKSTINNTIPFSISKLQWYWFVNNVRPFVVVENSKVIFDPFRDDQKNAEQKPVCGNGRFSFMILPNGEAGVCDFVSEDERFRVGNIECQSIEEIWNSEVYVNAVFLNREQFRDTRCYNCSQFYVCQERGFCVADMLLHNQNNFGPDYTSIECTK